MAQSLKIPFALAEDGRVVDARELPEHAGGSFRCAACKRPVMLRQGPVRVWHFAHRADVNCISAFETALHLLGKQILLEARYLRTPELVCRRFQYSTEADVTVSPEQLFQWETSGKLEEWLEGIRPDFLVISAGSTLVVEIAVTHRSGPDKVDTLRRLNIPAIEIDLSTVQRDSTVAEVRHIVLDSVAHKKWLFHPREAAVRTEAEALWARQMAEEEAVLEEQRQVGEREQAAERAARAERAFAVTRANKVFRGSSTERQIEYLVHKLSLPADEWPLVLGTHVRGATAIDAPLQVWQADLFRRFIYNRKLFGRNPSVDAADIADWMESRYYVSADKGKSLAVAIWDFLQVLEAAGYLVRSHRQSFSILTDKLVSRRSEVTVATRLASPVDWRAVRWSPYAADELRIREAAHVTQVKIPAGVLDTLSHEAFCAKGKMAESTYAHSVACTLKTSTVRAVEFLIAAGVFEFKRHLRTSKSTE